MARIFISYKRVDKEKVFKIKEQIESALGEKCWIDLDGIESDAQFMDVIIEAINKCEVVLFMYSEAHSQITDFDKDWTLRELNFAAKKKKRIVFVNIDNSILSDKFEFMYGTKQQVNATLPGSLEKLKKDLRNWLTHTTQPEVVVSPEILESQKLKTTEYPGVVIENGVLKKVPKDFEGHFVIGDEVKSIGDYAFSWCSRLTSVTISNSVTRIGFNVFNECKSLTRPILNNSCFAYLPPSYKGAYTIPSGIKQICSMAFYECRGLRSVSIPNSVKSIEHSAFGLCEGLTNVTIPDSVTLIGTYAFHGCKGLKSVTIPNSLEYVGVGVFWRCERLTQPIFNNSCFFYLPPSYKGAYTIPSGIKLICGMAFWECRRLRSVSIPNSVTSIGEYAFTSCDKLTSVTIPDSVSSIGDRAFQVCSLLTSVTIPNSVTRIGEKAIDKCKNIKAIYVSTGDSERVKKMLSEDLRKYVAER